MTDLSRDPVINVIHKGIKRDIQVAVDGEAWRAVVILSYCAVDTMAYLSMPSTQLDVTGDDFVAWCDRYIRFPGPEQLTGEDLYGARCAMVHTYRLESRLSRKGRCRQVGYALGQNIPAVRADPAIKADLAILSVIALKEAVFDAIDRFLVGAYTDRSLAPIVDARLKELIHVLPLSK